MTSARGKFFLVLALLAVPVLALLVSALRPKRQLPDLGEIPPFALVERTGRPIGRDDLRGRVWVASFLFTRCSGQCPILTQKLRTLQKEFQATDKLRLVSFSVDPENDTPAVLRSYAEREGADAYRWLFVTGEKAKLETLVANGFHVVGGLNHSAHFVLVDASSRVRGFYDANDPEKISQLIVDIRTLL